MLVNGSILPTKDRLFRILHDESIDRGVRNALANGVSQSCNEASVLLDLVAEEKFAPDIRERAASRSGNLINSSTKDHLFLILHDESIDRGVRDALANGVSQSCNDASVLLDLVAEEKFAPDIRQRAAFSSWYNDQLFDARSHIWYSSSQWWKRSYACSHSSVG